MIPYHIILTSRERYTTSHKVYNVRCLAALLEKRIDANLVIATEEFGNNCQLHIHGILTTTNIESIRKYINRAWRKGNWRVSLRELRSQHLINTLEYIERKIDNESIRSSNESSLGPGNSSQEEDHQQDASGLPESTQGALDGEEV